MKICRAAQLMLTATLALCVLQSHAAADPRGHYRLDVTPQLVTQALKEFAHQTKLQIVYYADIAEGISSQGAAGTLSATDALTQILTGTGLTFEFLNDRTVAIRLASGASGASGPDLDTRIQSDLLPDVSAQGSDARENWFGRFRLAQTGPSAAGASKGREQEAAEGQDLPAPEETTKGIPEVLVEGSKVLNMDIRRTRDDPQPYVIFDRERIEQSGATNIGDFLKQRLTMNTVYATGDQSLTSLGNVSSINLRGLGTNQTLILIDGHRAVDRVTLGVPGQPDINGIPVAAVERIEVLPTTASGIYGGGATGGVVNVILRRDYSGLETRLTYDSAFDTDDAIRRVDLAGGLNLEDGKTNFMIAGSYSDQNTLLLQDRDFYQRGIATALANNPSQIDFNGLQPPLGATTNILSANGSPLFGPGTSNHTFVPVGYAGGGGRAPLEANAGTYNLELANSAFPLGGGGATLSHAPTVKSLLATVRRQFTNNVQAFIEGSVSTNNGSIPYSRIAVFSLPATAPNNPFGQAIRVAVPTPSADQDRVSKNESHRAVGGLIVKLPAQWQAEIDYVWSRSSFEFSDPSSPLSAAGTAAIANGTIDVLRDTNAYPIDLAPYLNPSNRSSPFQTTLKDATLRFAGPVGSLPAGPLFFSALFEHRDEFIADAYSFPSPTRTNFFPKRSHEVNSVYVEGRLPLVSARNKHPGVQELELQVAGRHDDYTTNGATGSVVNPTPTTVIRRSTNETSSTDPTIALRYKPIESLVLRASYGTGFLAPSVTQILPNAPTTSNATERDPRRGNAVIGTIEVTSGGNANLQPEESKSWSAGMVLTPRFATGLRLSVDWSEIDKVNNIESISRQQILDNENRFPGRVIRGQAPVGDPFGVGPVIALDTTLVNIAKAKVEAYDVALDYGRETASIGAFDFFARATWQMQYKTQLLPSSPVVENVGVGGNFGSIPLKFKANGGLTWTYGGWTLGWTARYFHSYLVSRDPTTILTQGNGGRVPSQIYHDVFGAYRFRFGPVDGSGGWTSLFRDTEVQAGIKNVFDTKPPVDMTFVSTGTYYSYFGDARLASYYVTIRKSF